MKPTIGRIVHYTYLKTPNGDVGTSAAVITRLPPEYYDGIVDLHVFDWTPGFSPVLHCVAVSYSEEPKPGCWSWPPKA